MKRLVAALTAVLFLALPVMVGCESERKVERYENIQTRSEPTPVVMPDAP